MTLKGLWPIQVLSQKPLLSGITLVAVPPLIFIQDQFSAVHFHVLHFYPGVQVF
jgi:hypothetical protein